jgi:hypothetical protein
MGYMPGHLESKFAANGAMSTTFRLLPLFTRYGGLASKGRCREIAKPDSIYSVILTSSRRNFEYLELRLAAGTNGTQERGQIYLCEILLLGVGIHVDRGSTWTHTPHGDRISHFGHSGVRQEQVHNRCDQRVNQPGKVCVPLKYDTQVRYLDNAFTRVI